MDLIHCGTGNVVINGGTEADALFGDTLKTATQVNSVANDATTQRRNCATGDRDGG